MRKSAKIAAYGREGWKMAEKEGWKMAKKDEKWQRRMKNGREGWKMAEKDEKWPRRKKHDREGWKMAIWKAGVKKSLLKLGGESLTSLV